MVARPTHGTFSVWVDLAGLRATEGIREEIIVISPFMYLCGALADIR